MFGGNAQMKQTRNTILFYNLNAKKSLILTTMLLFMLVLFAGTASAQETTLTPAPFDGEMAVAKNTPLSINIQYVENNSINDTTFHIRISRFDGDTWVLVSEFDNVTNGTYTTPNIPAFSEDYTEYTWMVQINDSLGNYTANTYTFRTRGLLKQKWTANVGASTAKGERQLFPLMGDIDNDGVQEVVVAAGPNVVAMDGVTGAIEWTVPGVEGTALELADLDNDGIPEILVASTSSQMRLIALNGDGTTRWTSQRLRGEHTPMFPILAFDLDGDGYPTIFFAGQDSHPDPYSGNMDDYRGAVTKLDHNGNVLQESWLQKPCWGGFSLADWDYDGQYELYVSERRDGYHGLPAEGLQAYNADTLEMLWSRPDLQHSSPMAVIADVLGDEKLEVVATQITLKGPLVLDPTDGTTFPGYDYQNKRLPTHTTPAVYDLDNDGQVEVVYGTAYPSNAPKTFAVFDLISGQTEFSPTLEARTTWSPTLGDVTGDGNMEILVAVGEQMNYWTNYPLLVYDNQYRLIDRADITGAGQLSAAKLYDIDSDGLFEVVVGSANGRIVTFDTESPVPNPAPRTWIQYYSEYRAGTAVYVEPPGPKAPQITNELPENGSLNQTEPNLTVDVKEFQQDSFDLVFELFNGEEWVVLALYDDVLSGTYSASTAGFLNNTNSTEYPWKVTATDSLGNTATKEYVFSTDNVYVPPEPEPSNWTQPGWQYRKSITIAHEQVAEDIAGFPVLINMLDADLAAGAQEDGDDIFFTAADGLTLLDFEIEQYSAGSLVAWVKTDVSTTEDVVIYLYYGNNTTESLQSPADVWDSGYKAVYHLGNAEGADSTSNDFDGAPMSGPVIMPAGFVASDYLFDGVDDRVVLSKLFNDENAFTVEAWVKSDAKHGYIASQRAVGSSGMLMQYYPPEGNYQLYVNSRVLRVPASAGEWHYVVGTFDGTNARLYVNAGSPAEGSTSLTWPDTTTVIGDRTALGRAFMGELDEVRFSSVARTAGYIETSYNSQSDPGSFVSVGSEESENP